MIIVVDEQHGLPGYEQQQQALVIAIRRGNQYQLVKSVHEIASGMIDQKQLLAVIRKNLKKRY